MSKLIRRYLDEYEKEKNEVKVKSNGVILFEKVTVLLSHTLTLTASC